MTKFKAGDRVRLSPTYGDNRDLLKDCPKLAGEHTIRKVTASYVYLTAPSDTGGWLAERFELVAAQVGKFKVGDVVVLDMDAPINATIYRSTVKTLSNQINVVTRINHTAGISEPVSVQLNNGPVYFESRFKLAPAKVEAVAPEAPINPFKVGDKVRYVASLEKTHGRRVQTVAALGNYYGKSQDIAVKYETGGWDYVKSLELAPIQTKVAPAKPAPVSIKLPEAPAPVTPETFIIVVQNADASFAPASKPRTYSSEKQAKAVAISMAEKNPGLDFFVFKAVAKANTPVPATTFTNL